MKKEDRLIVYFEDSSLKRSLDRQISVVYCLDGRIYYTEVILDSIFNDAFNKSDKDGKERILNGLIDINEKNTTDVSESDSFKSWIEVNPNIKQKIREYKLNKIIK